MTIDGSDDKDWRLQAELDLADSRASLHSLVGRLREPAVFKEIQTAVPHDVVITHDGNHLFAYAADRATLTATRDAIEQVLRQDEIGATVRLSQWDDEFDEWRQTDPPPTADELRARDASERDAQAIETRTLIASSGKLIRDEFEQSLRTWADRLGLQCTLVEHPHLLTTQVAFTVTGPKHQIDEFAQGLAAEEHTTIRAETVVMLSPL